MMTFKSHRQFLVSNRIALFAGLILLLTAFTGLPAHQDGAEAYSPAQLQGANEVSTESDSTQPKRKLNVALLLFRHG